MNLATNPSVVLTTGCNSWDKGLDVMVDGQTRRVTGRAALERLAAAWRTKWDGSWRFEPADEGFRSESGGDVLVFAVEPTKSLAFSRQQPPSPAGSSMLPLVAFTHTRHLPPGK